MPLPQPGAIINLLLVAVCGAGAWLAGALTRTSPSARPGTAAGTAPAMGHQPGVFAADARALINAADARAAALDDLVVRYGSGSAGLELLAGPLMEKWAAADPEGARTEGLPRCMAHAPAAMPRAFAALARHPSGNPASLIAALPAAPLRGTCLTALATAWGETGNGGALTIAATLPRHERTLLVREWHRARGLADRSAAENSAAALTDPDDRESALTGTLFARAVLDPEATLRQAIARDDYPQIAETAFRSWVPRNPAAAWAFPAGMQGGNRLPIIAAALCKTETARRQPTEVLPEIQSLIASLFPGGPPLEVIAAVVPALAEERAAAAEKFVDFLPEPLRPAASVVLFDALCKTDPGAAWRLAGALVQQKEAPDHRGSTQWKSAAARENATPDERLAAGFPDFTDMTNLLLQWLESDTPAALQTFLGPGVALPLQKLAVETALHPSGTGIPREELMQWAKRQPPHIFTALEKLAPPNVK